MQKEYYINDPNNFMNEIKTDGKPCIPPKSLKCEGINNFFKYSGQSELRQDKINWEDKTLKWYIEEFKDHPPQNEEVLRNQIKYYLEQKMRKGMGVYTGACMNCLNCKCGGEIGRKIRRLKRKKKDSSYYNEYINRRKGGKEAVKKNKWIKYVEKFAKENPKIKGRELFEEASKYYKK
jgi:hypothetical protein